MLAIALDTPNGTSGTPFAEKQLLKPGITFCARARAHGRRCGQWHARPPQRRARAGRPTHRVAAQHRVIPRSRNTRRSRDRQKSKNVGVCNPSVVLESCPCRTGLETAKHKHRACIRDILCARAQSQTHAQTHTNSHPDTHTYIHTHAHTHTLRVMHHVAVTPVFRSSYESATENDVTKAYGESHKHEI
jgi:hypothetical protein